jgi:uncharacterized protein YdeI (YjbR/CyaY-like superfamily)
MPYIQSIDAYIHKSPQFAQPIFDYLRKIIHETCPEVEETIKWGMPAFYYRGPMCGFAAFKQHATCSFWKGSLMSDKKLLANASGETAMGHYGRITCLKDLPKKTTIVQHIKEAMLLNEKNIKVEKPKKDTKELPVPVEITNALKTNKSAKEVFEKFAPSHRKEYILWINETKRIETKEKRIGQMLDWLLQGKDRNWKYR